ncbi:MAG TPA: hypothetical protein VN688_10530, partial [Gemmataceae bacterium]|nr:hypothetical protein [Gemmataceae bacterium]
EKHWQALAASNAATAYRSINALTSAPEQTIPLLRERVHAVSQPNPQLLARLLTDLDSDRFEVREKAMKQIEAIGELAKPALRKTLAGNPSLEVRRRVEQLLVSMEPANSPEQLRALRAVEVLEYLGTRQARQVLETLASGVVEARRTREAKASLARLAR